MLKIKPVIVDVVPRFASLATTEAPGQPSRRLTLEEATDIANLWNNPIAPRCALCLDPVLPTEGDRPAYPYSCGCEPSAWTREAYEHLVRETLRDQQEAARARREARRGGAK